MFNQFEDKGQLAQVIMRRLNMTGASPAPAIAPELFPVFTYENDRPEWGYLKGEYRFGRTETVAAPPAGEHAAFVVQNGGNSGAIVVVKDICVTALATARIVQQQTFLASSPTTGVRRDSRQPSNSRTGFIPGRIAGASVTAGAVLIPANTRTEVEFIIHPGWELAVIAFNAAASMSASINWTERAAMIGELV